MRWGTQTVYARNDPSNPYLWRLKIGRLYIHKFYRGDADPDPHDHPARFRTFPLHSYVEAVYDPLTNTWAQELVWAWWFHYRPATHCHRVVGRWSGARTTDGDPILSTSEFPFWTIVLWGKREREWGFWRKSIWVPWTEYVHGNTKTWAED